MTLTYASTYSSRNVAAKFHRAANRLRAVRASGLANVDPVAALLEPHGADCSDCHSTDSAARSHAVPADRKLCGYHTARVLRFRRANPTKCTNGPPAQGRACGCR